MLARHVLELLQAKLPPIPEYQAEFQAGRQTYDLIFTARRILDEHWRAERAVHCLGFDIRAAFPSVDPHRLMDILQQQQLSPFLINRVRALAMRDLTQIRWGAAVRGSGTGGCGKG